MKILRLAALTGLAMSPLVSAQVAPASLDKLKQQFDADSIAALKPVVLRYAAQLEAARRTALQKGDARGAAAAEDALNDLRSKNPAVPIPVSAAATAPGATPAPPSLEELRNRMKGTQWSGEDGGHMTFAADGSVTTSWGTRGHWKIVTPRRMTIEWGKGKREEFALEPGLKTFSGPNGIKVHLKE
jgi:hypothetical protein